MGKHIEEFVKNVEKQKLKIFYREEKQWKQYQYTLKNGVKKLY